MAMSGAAGNGGAGGTGVVFTGTSATIINPGTISGAAGGSPGIPGTVGAIGGPGAAGARGAGIVGQGLTIINSGTISGGNAVTFTGGVNSLTITSTSVINGYVVAFSTADTFGLGGPATPPST